MGLENGKWRVVKGDCLWNIAKSVYGNGYRWTEIASANGLATSGSPIIYPGQLFTLPGITPGSSSTSATPTAPVTTNKVSLNWFALQAGTDRVMEAMWNWSGSVQHFWIKWEYYDSNGNKWVKDENTNYSTTTGETPQYQCTYDDIAKKCRVSIRPVKEDGSGYQDNTDWTVQEYDFSNNPPGLPPTPSIEIDATNKLTVTIENIDEDINADSIEIAIYQDNTTKYSTATATINTETLYAEYSTTVDAGHTYRVRCRSVRGTIYGGWTEFTSSAQARPVAPEEITSLEVRKISEQASTEYGVYVVWSEVTTAKYYTIEYTTDPTYFDDDPEKVSSKNTEEGKGPHLLITGLTLGYEYYFRVFSVNDKGTSIDCTAIKSVKLGSKPSAPTTWSNTTSNIIGEDLNLYWVHNATDGSIETYARLHIYVYDPLHPETVPTEITKVIPNEKPEEEKSSTSVYTINGSDSEWSMLKSGFYIKWKVQTAGVATEYSDWSVEREVNLYSKPTLELDITNNYGASIEEINSYPFYLNFSAKPAAQTPISYYIEIVSNDEYEAIDSTASSVNINPGDKVYQRYFDPSSDAWSFMCEMSPANVHLQNGINYTVNATVAMNSGLTASVSQSFDVHFNDLYYSVSADVVINSETLEASVHPYCYEYVEDESTGELIKQLTENCTMSVYRREYDGTFTEIATGEPNKLNYYVTDPHPALDYARYRIVATTSDTGAISYNDVAGVKVGEPSVIIQWSEKWSAFEASDSEDYTMEPAWSGSMIKIPYNIDISDNKSPDVSLIEYAGRKHPVSYYGTQIGETASWSVEIPADDKQLLYDIRRLSNYAGDVYVREPSGIGYWANLTVSYSTTHCEVTIPVSFTITRVEGGM